MFSLSLFILNIMNMVNPYGFEASVTRRRRSLWFYVPASDKHVTASVYFYAVTERFVAINLLPQSALWP